VRLDLFLKTARLIKRRTIARDFCDRGLVLINEQRAKASRDVRQGDIIKLRFSSRLVEIEVLGLPACSSRTVLPEGLYKLISEKRSPSDTDIWIESPLSS
jgi:ribosomal 50S subunit-recycling heat shock protein